MEQNKKSRLTGLERAWILYDVGNSAFVLLVATLIPIFFNALAEEGGLSSVDYLAYWGYAASAVTVITAVLSPILGTLADTRGFKKPIFILCLVVGVAGCCAMGLAKTWLPFLLIFVFAKVGFSGSLVFYDSMLGDVTTPDRMDVVSSRGYAWGYIGSCVPFVVCLALVLGSGAIGLSQMTALNIALFITAAWWLAMTLPLLKTYRQLHYVEVEKHAIRQSFARIGHTLRHLHEDKQVFWFLLAFFCYIDGVYTIIDMATAYGTALGLDTTGLLLALLVTQIVAFPSALIFGRLSAKYPSTTLIPVCVAAYAGIALFAFFLTHAVPFSSGPAHVDLPGAGGQVVVFPEVVELLLGRVGSLSRLFDKPRPRLVMRHAQVGGVAVGQQLDDALLRQLAQEPAGAASVPAKQLRPGVYALQGLSPGA